MVWRNDLVVWATDLVGVVAQRLPSAEGSFRRAVAGLLSFADRSSGLIQSGSLPRYIAIILLVAIALPSTALFRGGVSAGSIPVGGLLEGILGLLIVAAAVTLLFTTRRFAAVLLLGGVGYGVAALFAVFGGPDLSLTQLLVETLVVALFALVLRHLPTSFTPPRFERTMRIVVAVGVAVFVFVGGLTTISARQAASSVGPLSRTFGPRGPGSQRGQRHPGRLPRLGHARRDHGAGHRHPGRIWPGLPILRARRDTP